MTAEQKGSILLAIELLARALAFDDEAAVRLARRQLDAMFPDPAPDPPECPTCGHFIDRNGHGHNVMCADVDRKIAPDPETSS